MMSFPEIEKEVIEGLVHCHEIGATRIDEIQMGSYWYAEVIQYMLAVSNMPLKSSIGTNYNAIYFKGVLFILNPDIPPESMAIRFTTLPLN